MKNNKYIDSIAKIEPTAARQEYMLNRILSGNVPNAKNKNAAITKSTKIKRLAFLAACLVLILTVVSIGYNTNWFFINSDSATLSGGTLRFYKYSSPPQFQTRYDIVTAGRNLTATEADLLFSGITEMEGFGIFAKESGSLLHVEAYSGELKVCFSTNNQAATDTLLLGNKKASTLYGTKVVAGYFITDKNSKGQRNIIYYADFKLDDIVFNVEVGGDKSQAATLKNQAASAIDRIISKGAPNVEAITF